MLSFIQKNLPNALNPKFTSEYSLTLEGKISEARFKAIHGLGSGKIYNPNFDEAGINSGISAGNWCITNSLEKYQEFLKMAKEQLIAEAAKYSSDKQGHVTSIHLVLSVNLRDHNNEIYHFSEEISSDNVKDALLQLEFFGRATFLKLLSERCELDMPRSAMRQKH